MKLLRPLQWIFAISLIGLVGMALANNVFFLPWGDLIGWALAIVALSLVPILGCAAAHHRGRAPFWMLSGVVAGILSILISIVMLILDLNDPPPLFLLMMLPGWWCASMTVIALLLLAGGRGAGVSATRSIGSVVGIGALALFLIAVFVSFPDFRDTDLVEGLFRLGGALSVVYVCVTVGLWLVVRSRNLVAGETERVGAYHFAATCPRCRLHQRFATGHDTCSQCGLILRVVPT